MSQGKEFTKSGGMAFDNWWKILKWTEAVADLDILLGAQEDYREGYDQGHTPEEELQVQIDTAKGLMDRLIRWARTTPTSRA